MRAATLLPVEKPGVAPELWKGVLYACIGMASLVAIVIVLTQCPGLATAAFGFIAAKIGGKI